jgi:WD40 repeat protein
MWLGAAASTQRLNHQRVASVVLLSVWAATVVADDPKDVPREVSWDSVQGLALVSRVLKLGKAEDTSDLAPYPNWWAPCFSPDSKLLAAPLADGTVLLWDVETGEPAGPRLEGGFRIGPSTGGALGFSFSSDGSALGWSLGKRLVVWDLGARRLVLSREDLTGSPAWSPERSLLAFATREGVTLWDASSQRELRTMPGESDFLRFSTDGRLLAVANRDRREVTLWEVATGQPSGLPLKHDQGMNRALFSPDGRILAVAMQSGTLRFRLSWGMWDLAKRVPLPAPPSIEDAWSPSLAFSPDGSLLAFGGEHCRQVGLWSVPSGTHVAPPPTGKTRADGIRSGGILAFSPDGRVLVAELPGVVLMWDVTRSPPQLLERLEGHWNASIAFSRDGRTMAMRWHEGFAIWDVPTWKPVGTPIRKTVGRGWLRISPDGRIVATRHRDEVFLWDVARLRSPSVTPR